MIEEKLGNEILKEFKKRGLSVFKIKEFEKKLISFIIKALEKQKADIIKEIEGMDVIKYANGKIKPIEAFEKEKERIIKKITTPNY